MASLLMVVVATALAPVALAVARPVADALAQRRRVALPPSGSWLALAGAAPVQSGLVAAVAGAVALRWAGAPAVAVVTLGALGVAGLASLVDRRCHRLPDVLVGPLGGGAVVTAAGWGVATGEGSWIAAGLVAAVVAGGLLGVGWVVGMGLGDVKFGAALAVVVGWPTGSPLGAVTVSLGMIGLASVGAAVWWGWGAIVRRRAPRWFPFGPFLAAAAVCGVLAVGPPSELPPDVPGEPVRPAWAGHR